MKTLTEKALDKLWLIFCFKHDVAPLTLRKKKLYKRISKRQFFRLYNNLLTEEFCRYEFKNIESGIWLKGTENLIHYKIRAQVSDKYLPEIAKISLSWDICFERLSGFMNRYFEKQYGEYSNIFFVWVQNLYPRQFKHKDLSYALDEYENEEQLASVLRQFAEKTITLSTRFFNEFQTLDSIMQVMEQGEYAWGGHPVMIDRFEKLGFLYLLNKQPEKAIALYRVRIQEYSNRANFPKLNEAEVNKRIRMLTGAISAIESGEVNRVIFSG